MFSMKFAFPLAFSCILSQVLSLPPPTTPQFNVSGPEDTATLQISPINRAEVAATNIGDIFRSYVVELSNSTNSTGASHTGKKAYIQNTNTNNPNNPNNDLTIGFGFQNLGEIVPYLVENVLSPLIKHFVIDGNGYKYIQAAGYAPGGSVETPAATAAPPAEVKPSTTENSNSGRNLEEKASTTSPTTTPIPATTTKVKYTVNRSKDRAATSTGKPYEDNSDDEDETLVFNKIKHL